MSCRAVMFPCTLRFAISIVFLRALNSYTLLRSAYGRFGLYWFVNAVPTTASDVFRICKFVCFIM